MQTEHDEKCHLPNISILLQFGDEILALLIFPQFQVVGTKAN